MNKFYISCLGWLIGAVLFRSISNIVDEIKLYRQERLQPYATIRLCYCVLYEISLLFASAYVTYTLANVRIPFVPV